MGDGGGLASELELANDQIRRKSREILLVMVLSLSLPYSGHGPFHGLINNFRNIQLMVILNIPCSVNISSTVYILSICLCNDL